MKIKNPARHLPHYAVRVHLPDGTLFNKRGSAQPVIDVPVEEGEYAALILEGRTNAGVAQVKLLLVDGKWLDFSEEALAELLDSVPDPVQPTPEEIQRYEMQNEEIESTIYGSKPAVRKLPKPESKPTVRKLPKPGSKPAVRKLPKAD